MGSYFHVNYYTLQLLSAYAYNFFWKMSFVVIMYFKTIWMSEISDILYCEVIWRIHMLLAWWKVTTSFSTFQVKNDVVVWYFIQHYGNCWRNSWRVTDCILKIIQRVVLIKYYVHRYVSNSWYGLNDHVCLIKRMLNKVYA